MITASHGPRHQSTHSPVGTYLLLASTLVLIRGEQTAPAARVVFQRERANLVKLTLTNRWAAGTEPSPGLVANVLRGL